MMIGTPPTQEQQFREPAQHNLCVCAGVMCQRIQTRDTTHQQQTTSTYSLSLSISSPLSVYFDTHLDI
jgi:hypothetical protein